MIATTAATAPEMRRHARSVSAAFFVVTSCWELSHAGTPLPADTTARPDLYVTRLEAALRDIAQVRVVIGRATALADGNDRRAGARRPRGSRRKGD